MVKKILLTLSITSFLALSACSLPQTKLNFTYRLFDGIMEVVKTPIELGMSGIEVIAKEPTKFLDVELCALSRLNDIPKVISGEDSRPRRECLERYLSPKQPRDTSIYNNQNE